MMLCERRSIPNAKYSGILKNSTNALDLLRIAASVGKVLDVGRRRLRESLVGDDGATMKVRTVRGLGGVVMKLP